MSKKKKRTLRIIGLLIIAVVMFSVSLRISRFVDLSRTDFFKIWLLSHMTVTGQNPYDEEQWLENHKQNNITWIPENKSLYPITLGMLLAPIGMLDYKLAFIVWIFLSQVMILASIILCLKLWPGEFPRQFIFPTIAASILFRPVIILLLGGQLSAMILLFLCATAYLWEKGNWKSGGFIIAMSALKPNTGAPLLGFLMIWLLFQKKWKGLLGLTMGVISILLVGVLINPGWLREYILVGNQKLSDTFGFSPTLWGLASPICRYQLNCVLFMGGSAVSLLGLVIGYILINNKNPVTPSPAISLSIIGALLITPYLWPYDQVLLILPILFIMKTLHSRYPYLVSATLFLCIDLITIGLLLVTIRVEKENFNGLISILVFILVVWCLRLTTRSGFILKTA